MKSCAVFFPLFPGIKPTSHVWSEETVVTLKQLVCNRFLRVEILGERDGTALVAMDDESSDPQTNVAELLVATGHATVGDMETKKEEACESAGKCKERIYFPFHSRQITSLQQYSFILWSKITLLFIFFHTIYCSTRPSVAPVLLPS